MLRLDFEAFKGNIQARPAHIRANSALNPKMGLKELGR